MKNRIAIYAVFAAIYLHGSLANAQGIIDKSVIIKSIGDLDRLNAELRRAPAISSDWDSFNRAVSVIEAYVLAEYPPQGSFVGKDRLIEVLLSGRTPREIIVLGHVLWLERTRRANLEIDGDSAKLADKIPPGAEDNRQQAKSLGIANEKMAIETIKRYTVCEPDLTLRDNSNK